MVSALITDLALSELLGSNQKYVERIREMAAGGSRSFLFDVEDLAELGGFDVVREAKADPTLFLGYLKKAVLTRLMVEEPELAEVVGAEWGRVRDRLVGKGEREVNYLIPIYPRVVASEVTHESVSSLLSAAPNTLVCFRGVVVAASPPRREVVVPVFRCLRCGAESVGERVDFSVISPSTCGERVDGDTRCGGRLLVSAEESVCAITVQLKVQDVFDVAADSQQPHEVTVSAPEEVVRRLSQGDRVLVTGILRVSSLLRYSSASLFVYVEALSVERDAKDYRDLNLTEEDKKAVVAASKQPDIKQRLIASIAPAIRGREEVKEGILLALFGAPAEVNPDGTVTRGDIHILMVGDPGVGKSQMLLSVSKLVPRGVYVSGPRSSGVGLTAAVLKDETTGRFMIHAGSAVLANGGVLIVDELDKMSKDDRGALHEVLEQQTVTVAKAGIYTQLPARCTMIAAANPKMGSFNPNMSLAENIDLPTTILSRFDLIYILMDEIVPKSDEEVARFVLKRGQEKAPAYPPEFVRKYIAFAKNITPALAAEAEELLTAFYVQVRQKCAAAGDAAVKVGVRQLEAAKRLSLAHARLRFSSVVEKVDVEAALRLMNHFLEKEGFLTELSQLEVGKTSGELKSEERAYEVLKNMFTLAATAGAEGIPEEDYVLRCREEGIEERYVRKLLEAWKRKGVVMEPKNGKIRPV